MGINTGVIIFVRVKIIFRGINPGIIIFFNVKTIL